MNKNFWKRFLTWNPHHNDGFTLVELIVVIAILAILAAVAVPAYSGYIDKANRAGDEQLLAAVNKAFASACLAEGVDILELDSNTAKMLLDANKKIDLDKLEPANVADDFEVLFDGNENSAFKIIDGLFFDKTKLAFVADAQETVTYAGSTISVPLSVLQALKDSTYGDVGSAALLGQINKLTDYAKVLTLDDKLEAIFTDPAYLASAMESLGADATNFDSKYAAVLNTMMGEPYNMTDTEAENQLKINAAVLYAAKNAVDFTDEQISTLFSSTGAGTIVDNMKTTGKTAEGMAQATLVYGMYTAYANSEYGSDAAKNKLENSPINVLQALNDDPKFLEYVNSPQGQTDMEALKGALGVIVDSTDNNAETTTHLMINGFNNTELQGVLGGLMG